MLLLFNCLKVEIYFKKDNLICSMIHKQIIYSQYISQISKYNFISQIYKIFDPYILIKFLYG
jgi:hypothetical protein